ncbi:hypothetical protein TNCV_2801991 [Trichonephila clavipes]|nr:hypothetical protein TNCV_2801991 [Trichonephila clavipes]
MATPGSSFTPTHLGHEDNLENLRAPLIRSNRRWAAGSLVVRASDSRPEALGSMPDATRCHQMPPDTLRVHTDFHAEIVEAEIGGVAINRTFGEFRRAKSYCHLYGAQGQRQVYL